MALEPALSFERVRHDIDSEMGLAARPVAGMPDVLMRFVNYVEAFGGESGRQLLHDEIAGCHGVRPEHFPEKWIPVFRRKCDRSKGPQRRVAVNGGIRQR